MQLVAYGAQDIYLTGNPQITFFKVVYRRHTNFAMEAIPQSFSGEVNYGKKVSCTIPRNGDLVGRCYLRLKMAAFTGGVNGDVRRIIKNCELEIGGQRIDKQYYEWQAAWQSLTYSQAQKDAMSIVSVGTGTANDYYYLPLDFFFCRHAGLALPLIALQYHEVKITLELAAGVGNLSKNGALQTAVTDGDISSGELLVDYFYLDTDERRRFAQVSHEYLIEQVQHTGTVSLAVGTSTTKNVKLNFNHPVKELIWSIDAKTGTDLAYVNTAKLQLNGHDRFKELDGDYFMHVQRLQHHTGPVGSMSGASAARARTCGVQTLGDTGYYCYSFAIRPEEHQPSGTCNFSRIDNATLQLTYTVAGAARNLWVFAHGYNVLRVMSGMGGLAYSN